MTESTRDAIIKDARQRALAQASNLGLTVEAAPLIRFGCNALFHLQPHGIVARVSGMAAHVRSHVDARVRELDVCRYLVDAGMPVAPPSDQIDPGPYIEDELVITF